MSTNASQITCVTIACATVCSGADQRKHQSSASLAFVRGIHRWPVDSPHKGPVTWKMFPLYDVIMHRIYKDVSAIYIIPPHWHDTGSWDPSSCKTRTYLFYKVNVKDADVLVTQGLEASVTMIFTGWTGIIRARTWRVNKLIAWTKWPTFCRGHFQQILFELSLKFVPTLLNNNYPALVQIMAWCPTSDKSLSKLLMAIATYSNSEGYVFITWWRHRMETFSALLGIHLSVICYSVSNIGGAWYKEQFCWC